MKEDGDAFIVIASKCCLPFEKWWNENVIIGDDGQTFTPPPPVLHSFEKTGSQFLRHATKNSTTTDPSVIFRLLYISINNSAINHTNQDERKMNNLRRKKVGVFQFAFDQHTYTFTDRYHDSELRSACVPFHSFILKDECLKMSFISSIRQNPIIIYVVNLIMSLQCLYLILCLGTVNDGAAPPLFIHFIP